MKFSKKDIVFTMVLVLVTTLSKFFFAPKIEWAGISPVIAIALFSGMMVKDKTQSFILPLVALFLSDVLIQILYKAGLFVFPGLYKGQLFNYSLLLLTTVLGWLLKGKRTESVIISAVIAPTLFFLLSNFFVWNSATQLSYPKNFNGLLLCYGAGLPFYKNALIASVVFLPSLIAFFNVYVKGSKALKITLA